MKAQLDLEVGEYLLCRTANVDGEIVADVDRTFWFPDKSVKKGDWVVLYTKVGNPKVSRTEAGNVTHFFYWGVSETLWGATDRSAILMHVDTWKAFRPDR